MIVRPRPSLLGILFTLRGSILPQVAPTVAGLAAFSVAVVAAERRWPEAFPVSAGIGPFTLIGLALSIFLSFRNNACYERWWEARKAWGNLIVAVRSLARLVDALLPGPGNAAARARVLRRAAGFAHGLHAGLRGADAAAAIRPWLPPGEPVRVASPSDGVLAAMTVDLAAMMRAGAFGEVGFALVEGQLARLAEIQAACERIQATPLPFAYTLLLYRTAWLYCLFLPVGLSGSLGWATPAAVALVAYTFFGLDALGDELEEPFGLEPNDLPLDAMLRVVERTVLEPLGKPLPDPVEPEDFLLR